MGLVALCSYMVEENRAFVGAGVLQNGMCGRMGPIFMPPTSKKFGSVCVSICSAQGQEWLEKGS